MDITALIVALRKYKMDLTFEDGKVTHITIPLDEPACFALYLFHFREIETITEEQWHKI